MCRYWILGPREVHHGVRKASRARVPCRRSKVRTPIEIRIGKESNNAKRREETIIQTA
jgi:hypothetical protein